MVATSRRGKHRMAHRRRLLAVPLAVVTIAAGVVQSQAPPSHAEAAGRSDFCHVTDGTFTACPDGHREWADVPAKAFAAEHAFLYSDQADLDARSTPTSPVDTLTLLYDECARTRPLGPDQYFLVSFDTAVTEDGKEKFERYTVHIFGDGTLIFLEDGKLKADPTGKIRAREIEGQRGAAGFGPAATGTPRTRSSGVAPLPRRTRSSHRWRSTTRATSTSTAASTT